MVGARVGELIGEAQLIYNWEAYPEDVARWSTPTRPRTRPSARRTSRWPASPCTPRLNPRSTGRAVPRRRSPSNAHGYPVTMPALGESVTEGTVTRWLKQDGDQVAGRRAAAGGLHRQGRHRDPVARSPAPAGDHGRRRTRPSRSAPSWASSATTAQGGGSDGGGASAEASSRHSPAPQRAASRQADAAASPSSAGRSEHRAAQAEDAPAAAGAAAAPAAAAPAAARPAAPAAAAPAADGTSVTLPALGESVTEGTVTRWLKQVGDEVAVDEPLLEVSTDKVDTEIPSPVAGTLLEIKVARGRDRRGRRRARRHRQRRRASGVAAATPRPAHGATPAARDRQPSPSRHQPAGSPSRRQQPAASRGRSPAPAQAAAPTPHQQPRRPPTARAAVQWRRARLRHPAGPQARRRARRRPRRAAGHRRRRPDPQAGRAGRRVEARRPASAQRTGSPAASPHPAAAAPAAPHPAAPGPDDAGRGVAAARCAARTEKMTRLRKVIAKRHGRVAAGLGAAHHGRRGRRHPDRPPADRGQGRVRGPRGRQALLPAVLREGRRRGAQGVPELNAAHRHRRRARSPTTTPSTWASPSTPSAACWSRSITRRGRPQHRRPRPQDRRPRRAHPQQQDQRRTSCPAARSR